MGEYLTIIWEAETPTAATVPWDSCGLIVRGAEASLTESKVLICNGENWGSVLTSAGFSETSQAYKSTAQFFAASPAPGGDLHVLGLVSGSISTFSDTPLKKVTNYIYETPVKPPLGFDGTRQVKYFPDANLTGYFINKADGSEGMGFVVEEDGFGKWTGRLNFLSGLSGVTIDLPPRTGSKITASFRVGQSTSDLTDLIEQYNINMIAAAYENTRTIDAYSNTYFGSMVEDFSRISNAIAGKDCIFFWAMPGGTGPTDTATGFGDTWSNFKSIVGSREEIAPCHFIPSNMKHDMAAGYMGMVAGEHPHRTISFKVPHMGIYREATAVERAYWANAQVATAMKKRNLAGQPYLVTYGFTLGTGYASRINYVRCKGIISKTLINGLWELLASRKVVMSYAGMQLVKSKIEGIFNTLKSQGIIDDVAYVRIPIEEDLKNNTAAGQSARAAREIPAIEIGFYWYSSLEKITITGIRNEA